MVANGIRVGSAPVSWGIFELTTDDENLIAPDTLLSAMRACGYTGTESGPPGYLGDATEARRALASHELAFAGTFLPTPFSHADWREAHRPALADALSFVQRITEHRDDRVVLLSDAYLEPARLRMAGRVTDDLGLDARGWERMHAHVNEAAALCRELDLIPAFHYHAGSYVETPREIDRLVQGLDLDLIGLCFDSGHSAFGGGDPLEFLASYGAHVVHVHLKDVDERILASSAGTSWAWTRAGDVGCSASSGAARRTCAPASSRCARTTTPDGSSSSRTASPRPATTCPGSPRRRSATASS